MFHRRRALSYAPPASSSGGTRDLTYLGAYRPVTSTNTAYSSLVFNTTNIATAGTSGQKWYIMGVATRDASGEQTPNWSQSINVTQFNLGGTVTAKQIGYTGSASATNSYTSTAFYAWSSADTQFTGSIGLNRTHEGGVAITLWEFDYSGSDLYYSRSFGSNTTVSSLTHSWPNRLWSDYPVLHGRFFDTTERVHLFWVHGTSNATAGTPSTNSNLNTWTQAYYIEHGTAEYARWYYTEWTNYQSQISVNASGGGTSATANTTLILAIGGA